MAAPPPPDDATTADALPSLGEAHRSVSVSHRQFWRRFFAFSGPGYMVAVGYMDPGNWATGIAGGSAFGYRLLCVVLLANLAAVFLQGLAAKLGIATGMDLAQASRRHYGPRLGAFLWLCCELAIIACDLAELIGAAVALKLLFGIPLVWGVTLTGLEVFLLLGLQARGYRLIEATTLVLILVIGGCFAVELMLARPDIAAIADGLIPRAEIIQNQAMLYVAIGILGATVMPHNLYLHSSLVQTRRFERSVAGRRQAMRFAWIDTVVALSFAVVVNAGILILAASTFHVHGDRGVADLQEAYRLLSPILGASVASTLFAVALLASGQSSSITGTMAGQIVMEGFTGLRWPPWIRRLVSRALAMIPALAAIGIYGEGAANSLLIFSQVVLSLQLPFAVYPLVRFTGKREWMGPFTNGPVTAITAWSIVGVLIALNGWLVFSAIRP